MDEYTTTTNDKTENNATITVCIGNYGYYNEGILRDKWVSLPMAPSDLARWTKDNGLRDEAHEETYVSDFDGKPFDTRLLDCASIEQINQIAFAMAYAGESGVEATSAVIRLDGAPKSIDGLIKLLYASDEIGYTEFPLDHWGQPSLELYAYDFAEETGLLQVLQEQNAESYFDFEHYGQDLMMDVLSDETGFIGDIPDSESYSIDEVLYAIGYTTREEGR